MIEFVVVENAIAEWLAIGAEVDEDSVAWMHQGGPRREPPYITISSPLIRRYGSDWQRVVKNVDGTITHKVQGPRTINVMIQCFGAEGVGAESPRALLEKAITKIALPSFQRRFRRAHVGPGPIGTINSAQASEDFEPRAYVAIDFHVGAEVSEPGFVIERFEVSINDQPPVVIPENVGEMLVQLDDMTAGATGSIAIEGASAMTLGSMTVAATGTVT